MKKLILIILIQTVFYGNFSEAESENPEKAIAQSIELYNSQKYNESLTLLDSVKNNRDQYNSWYYYYALNKLRLDNYQEALLNFEDFIKSSSSGNTAKAYYYSGLIQFNIGEYEKALNSLELSLDISKDPKFDTLTEALIDKVIRYQNYYENNKKTNITALLSYNFDSNTINLSQDSFADSLNGHVLGYGVSISHKIIDKYKFIFEPTVAVLDNYTLDSKLKANSILQSTDALQFLLSAPVRFYYSEDKYSNKYEISLNGYSVYLPVTMTERELTLSSVFLKTQVLTTFTTNFTLKYNLTLAADTSYGFTSADDDASGTRLEFATSVVQYLSNKNITNIFYDLGINISSTKGINTRFNKYLFDLGYMFPSFSETISSFRLGAIYLNYAEKANPRTDSQININCNITKSYLSGTSIGFSLGGVSNSSNVDLNKYSEVVAGFQYLKTFGF